LSSRHLLLSVFHADVILVSLFLRPFPTDHGDFTWQAQRSFAVLGSLEQGDTVAPTLKQIDHQDKRFSQVLSFPNRLSATDPAKNLF